jgi:hypothetical protein
MNFSLFRCLWNWLNNIEYFIKVGSLLDNFYLCHLLFGRASIVTRNIIFRILYFWHQMYNVRPWWTPKCNLLGYRRHYSIYYTRLFPTSLVLVTISLLQWVLTLWCLLISSSSECWQLTDRLLVTMLLKSNLFVRNRIHLVARFPFPVLALSWIPIIWLRRRLDFILR